MNRSLDIRAKCPYYRKFDGEALLCMNEAAGRLERRCLGAEDSARQVARFCSLAEPDCPVYTANLEHWERQHHTRIFPHRPEPCAMELRCGDRITCTGYKIELCPGHELCPYYVSRDRAAVNACRTELRLKGGRRRG